MGMRTAVRRGMRRLAAAQTPAVVAVVDDRGDEARIRYGDRVLTVRAKGLRDAPRPVEDFAPLFLAAISVSRGRPFVYEGPVSRSAEAQLRRYGLVLRSLPGLDLHPLRLTLPNVVDPPPGGEAGRMLALSGGVDSTYAAVTARDRLTHLMYVDGDGFPESGRGDFAAARRRAAAIAEALGLELIIVETDAREHFGAWWMLHTTMLAGCLHFAGRGLGGGAIAADVTPQQELLSIPWGNLGGIVACLGTDGFGIDYLGGEASRTQKVVALAQVRPELFAQITVCMRQGAQGGNCGTCEKCLRTRFCMAAIEPEALRRECEARAFPGAFDPLAHVRQFVAPRERQDRVNALRRLDDVARELPPGPLRDELDGLLRRLFSSVTSG